MRLRADLRRRWLSLLLIAVLVGLAFGVVLTAAAGARRTASTLARVDRASHAADVLVNPDNNDFDRAGWKQIDDDPDVAGVAAIDGLSGGRLDASGNIDQLFSLKTILAGNPDGRLFQDVEAPRVIAGRTPRLDRADEIEVSEVAAREFNLHVGDVLHFGWLNKQHTDERRADVLDYRTSARITGIVAILDDVTRADDDPRLSPTVLFTPGFSRAYPDIGKGYYGKYVRLRKHASLGEFEKQTSQLLKIPVNYQEHSLTVARARRTVRPYVVALAMFAALALLAALAVLGQLIARSLRPLRDERDVLSAIGVTRGQLAWLGGARGLLIGALATAVALITAVLASPLMPIGPLRKIEPARGLDADFFVLFLGAIMILALCVAIGVVTVLTRGHVARNRIATAAGDQFARAGAPVQVTSGVRFALDRGKDGTVPLRSTLIGVVVALTALTATVVFGAGLTAFTSTSERFGWPWTFAVEQPFPEPPVLQQTVDLLRGRPGVGVTHGVYSQFVIGPTGNTVAAVGLDTKRGTSFLPLLRGRAPQANNEIVLGAKTMSSLGVHLGGIVDVSVLGAQRPFRIVGIGVFPRFAPYPGSEPTGLGIGAATTMNAVTSLKAQLGAPFLLVRGGDANLARLVRHDVLHDDPLLSTVLMATPQRPNDVLSYDRLTSTPLLLAAVLGLLAIASTVHLLVTGVRSRRRDVALLKTIGMSRRQALASVLVQSTTLMLISLLVAVPLGVLAGRWLWVETAHWLGIADDLALPYFEILGLVAIALVGALLIATPPGLLAARIRPAVALRSE
jgi:putative ABC transport system permease protein